MKPRLPGQNRHHLQRQMLYWVVVQTTGVVLGQKINETRGKAVDSSVGRGRCDPGSYRKGGCVDEKARCGASVTRCSPVVKFDNEWKDELAGWQLSAKDLIGKQKEERVESNTEGRESTQSVSCQAPW